MPHRRSLVLLLLALLLSSCGASNTETKGVPLSKTAALEQVGTIEIKETNERFIGTLNDVDIKLNPFRMYVADRKMHRVVVVTRDGKIERYIGRPGNGPGELQNPSKVLVAGNRVVVYQARQRGFEVFDTTGTYIDSYPWPEGHWYGGLYDLCASGNGGYVLPLTSVDVRQTQGKPVSPDQSTIALLSSKFDVVETFGTFPSFYRNGEYMARQRTLDINNDSLAAVGYRLVPDVQLYDLTKEGIPKIAKLSLDHPAFHPPEQEMTYEMARESPGKMKDILSNASAVAHTSLLNNGVIVQNFSNQTRAYYEKNFPEGERDHYAILGKIGTDEQKALTLPGRLLTRDEKDRLYIELNHVPDERKIGIYEVNWP